MLRQHLHDPAFLARMPKDLPLLFLSGDADPVGEQGKGFDPRKLLAPGSQAIIDKCKEKIELFGCAGKA